jgi:hypothetical protein
MLGAALSNFLFYNALENNKIQAANNGRDKVVALFYEILVKNVVFN